MRGKPTKTILIAKKYGCLNRERFFQLQAKLTDFPCFLQCVSPSYEKAFSSGLYGNISG
jgi:hypothetical protein